jgi:hypothetical protein
MGSRKVKKMATGGVSSETLSKSGKQAMEIIKEKKKDKLKDLLDKAKGDMKPMPYDPKTQAPKFEGKPYNPKTDKRVLTPLSKKRTDMRKKTTQNEGMKSNWFEDVGKEVMKAKGGSVKAKKGRRGDGICVKGRTKGRMV